MAESFAVFSSRGFTSTIYSLPGEPPRVCKAFNQDKIEYLYPVEQAVYERFSKYSHPSSILKYYGTHETIPAGLVLELASNGDLHDYRWQQMHRGHEGPEYNVLLRWARQAAEALEFAHSVGVLNSDIHCINFFLDAHLNLKVGDWAGASIDGSKSRSSYRLRHRLFDESGADISRATGISTATEIFALGTALYRMIVVHEPWPELDENKPEDRELIRKCIAEKNFPNISTLPVLGDVILKCWNVVFTSMREVRQAIEAEAGLDASKETNRAVPSVLS
jgi:serine/threonine protein kinase